MCISASPSSMARAWDSENDGWDIVHQQSWNSWLPNVFKVQTLHFHIIQTPFVSFFPSQFSHCFGFVFPVNKRFFYSALSSLNICVDLNRLVSTVKVPKLRKWTFFFLSTFPFPKGIVNIYQIRAGLRLSTMLNFSCGNDFMCGQSRSRGLSTLMCNLILDLIYIVLVN